MNERLKAILEKDFGFSPNRNQLKDLERLIFEIMRRENISQPTILGYLRQKAPLDKYQGRNRFFCLKQTLIERRFPLTAAHEKIDTKKVFLTQVRLPLKDSWTVGSCFKPHSIYVEKEVKNSYLADNFQKRFPDIPLQTLNRYSDYLQANKFSLDQLKKPIVFIIKEKWDFIKPCPCTKGHVRCGYWIFNLGFGCPYDCSYCFLQQYANFPGLLLPANIDDFFEKFDAFAKKLKKPIRIGTGEFSDSLALDHITEYSTKLIPYFKRKNVFFEFKTKSSVIGNLLTMNPPKNIIISWSLNPASIIEQEEKGTASLLERLEASRQAQKAGYTIGFHFDPIIHSSGWQPLYEQLVNTLYEYCKPPFAWISLGTLRCNRALKTKAELRLRQTNIFYGELLLAEDKKLRYPLFLRQDIYKKMHSWIREHDQKTPLYLCMEDKNSHAALSPHTTETTIERLLLKKKGHILF